MNKDHIQPFNSNALAGLDGGALGLELDRQIGMLCRDINDRPMDCTGKATPARKLKVEFTLTPVIEFDKDTQSPALTGIEVEPHVDGITPKVTGGKTEVRMIRGKLLYNKSIPTKFDQMPLFPEDEEADRPQHPEESDAA
jgi:hypothetical protein